METIVVGVDGSAGALVALRFAVAEARRRGARVRAVSAWFAPTLAFGAVGVGVPYDPRELYRDNAAGVLEQAIESLGEDAREVEIEPVVSEGQAARVLVEEATEAELLVVGSRGLGGFSGLLLGSVGQECAQHARCPLVIVPSSAERSANAAQAG